MCPHFSSSHEWFPDSITHLHTLHLYNNFLDYPAVDLLVTRLRSSSVTSLDLGQHRMLASETVAVVESLAAPNGATRLVSLCLDVSKYAAQNPRVGWDTLRTASHLATNVGHWSLYACVSLSLAPRISTTRQRYACST